MVERRFEWLAKYFVIPQRVILAIMGFLAVANAYTMRLCLSVAITQMVDKEPSNSTGTEEGVCYQDSGDMGSTHMDDLVSNTFEWSEELQGVILSAFYWGYVITHLPGGMLATRYGGKHVLNLGIFSTAIFTLLTPLVVNSGGSTALIALRVLEGLGEGTTFPALSALLAAWIPITERSILGALVFSGAQLGTIIGNSVSGLLIDSTKTWESPFYFFGVMALVWCLLFHLLCYSTPKAHPFIKQKELTFLEDSLEANKEQSGKALSTPWRSILTSKPMIALVIAQIGHDWGLFVMITDLPKYMADVLQFSIKENGLYSALPYVLMWIVSLSLGFLGDFLIRRKYLSITVSRKTFTSFAAIGPGVFVVLASYAGCDRTMVIVLFTLAMGSMGAYYPGMKVNPLDLSPNFAGTLMAITNGIGAITGIITPIFIGFMTPNANMMEWRVVFWTAFGILVGTNFVYIFWASGEVQPWNEPKKEIKDRIEEDNAKSRIAEVDSKM